MLARRSLCSVNRGYKARSVNQSQPESCGEMLASVRSTCPADAWWREAGTAERPSSARPGHSARCEFGNNSSGGSTQKALRTASRWLLSANTPSLTSSSPKICAWRGESGSVPMQHTRLVDAAMRVDDLVHGGLGQRGVVQLIVPPTTEATQSSATDRGKGQATSRGPQ